MSSLSRINENHLQVLCAIESNPGLMQRQRVQVMGVSLGKVYYSIKALIDKGLVKMGNFSHNQKKMDYTYLLTSSGVNSKAILTARFLERKATEYAILNSKLENMKKTSST